MKVKKKETLEGKKELTMPREHGDSEDPGVCGAIKPERVFQISPPNREYIVEGQPDTVDSRQEKIGEIIEPFVPDDGAMPLLHGDSQLCGSFRPVVPVKDIVLRRPCVIQGRLKRTIAVKDLQGPSFECVLDDNTGSVVLVFLGRRPVPGMLPGAVLLVQGTPGILDDRTAMINPLYEFLPKTIDVAGSVGFENKRALLT